jgi:lysophospholipid hydrolase
MEFKRFPELLVVGFDTATRMLKDWAKEGKLPTGMVGEISAEKVKKRGQSIRRNSI